MKEHFYTPLNVLLGMIFKLENYEFIHLKFIELYDDFIIIEKNYSYLCDENIKRIYDEFMWRFDRYYTYFREPQIGTVTVIGSGSTEDTLDNEELFPNSKNY